MHARYADSSCGALDSSATQGRTPVLYVDDCVSMGGAPICLAAVLPYLETIRPVVQHALPPRLAEMFSPWEAVYEGAWDSRVLAQEGPAGGSAPRKRHRVLAGATLMRDVIPAAARIARRARRVGARIIHANDHIGANLPAILAARWLGVPCIVHQRIFEPQSRLVQFCSRFVTRHVAMARCIAAQLEDWGVPRDRIAVVYDGIDLGTICPPRPAGDHVTVGTVTRFVPWKGVHVAVEAALRVAAARPHVRFEFVGGEAPEAPGYFRELQARVAASPHADRVGLLGEQPDGWKLMRNMDVFLHTAVEPEPFGRVVTEAMAAGCAVVATDHGGPVEICEGGAGLLVPPGDATALAAAVIGLVDNGGERARLQQRGQARLRERFDIRDTARQLEALYAACLELG